MRISDWSSDVCSSDLLDEALGDIDVQLRARGAGDGKGGHRQRNGGEPRGKGRPGPGRTGFQALHRRHDPNISLGLKVRFICFHSEYCATGSSKGMHRSEEHTSELQSLMRNPYAV